jgi:hypothetical protein
MNASRTRSATKTTTASAKASASAATIPRHTRNTSRSSAAEIRKIRFEALKGTFYHEGLEAHYSRIHRWLLFAVTLLGTATTAQLFSSYPQGTLTIGLATTIAGLVDLVFDLSGKARTHGFLRRRFIELSEFCEDAEWHPSSLKARLQSLYEDEPPQFHAANAVAYNNARRALYDNEEPEKLLVVPKRVKLLKNWARYDGFDFKRRNEMAPSQSASPNYDKI